MRAAAFNQGFYGTRHHNDTFSFRIDTRALNTSLNPTIIASRSAVDVNARKSARRVFSAGIVLSGGLLIFIGLIMGFQFPNYVSQRTLQSSCIANPNSVYFHDWESNAFRGVVNNWLFYWNITNPTQVLRGIPPKMKLVGPYAYEEMEKKQNVRFNGYYVTYTRWRTQKFFFQGHDENDTLWTYNPAYWDARSKYSGNRLHMLGIPRLAELINRRSQVFTSGEDFTLGGDYSRIHFDSWIEARPERRLDLFAASQTDVSEQYFGSEEPSEAMNLYPTLTRRGKWKFGTDSSVCYSKIHQLSPDVCGLAFVVDVVRDGGARDDVYAKLFQLARGIFIRGTAWSRANDTESQRRLLQLLVDYILQVLLPYSESATEGLPPLLQVTQRELALGHEQSFCVTCVGQCNSSRRSKENLTCPNGILYRFEVRGILEHSLNEGQALQNGPVINLTTCLLGRSFHNNLRLVGMETEGEWEWTSSEGFTWRIPPTATLRCCGSVPHPGGTRNFHLEYLDSGIPFQGAGNFYSNGMNLAAFHISQGWLQEWKENQRGLRNTHHPGWRIFHSDVTEASEIPSRYKLNLVWVLLAVACGGVIAFSCLGGCIIIFGCLVVMFHRNHRIAPLKIWGRTFSLGSRRMRQEP
ncbi:unnamed protein product [Darwinula stevensoni]|uniref:Uncharacterized protein n=1 Tax=Darwinula stevensoni TaxID=69355 RepID=A0A7R9A2B7_9CRUS|nr:unnamed protein product [Darwinula stevensoni]CAG0885334.1 unnamed protein product [Darwinula stevensoni]